MKASIENLLDDGFKINSENSKDIRELFVNEIIEGNVDEYFKILNTYIKTKKNLKFLTSDVSKESGLPEITIKKFENLQVVPRILTVIKILKTVGLRLTVVPIEDSQIEPNL